AIPHGSWQCPSCPQGAIGPHQHRLRQAGGDIDFRFDGNGAEAPPVITFPVSHEAQRNLVPFRTKGCQAGIFSVTSDPNGKVMFRSCHVSPLHPATGSVAHASTALGKRAETANSASTGTASMPTRPKTLSLANMGRSLPAVGGFWLAVES